MLKPHGPTEPFEPLWKAGRSREVPGGEKRFEDVETRPCPKPHPQDSPSIKDCLTSICCKV